MNDLFERHAHEPIRRFIQPVETTLRAGQTIAESLAAMRRRSIPHKVVYFYVVDEQDRLLGVVSTRSLLLSDSGARVDEVMDRPAVSVPASMTLADAMEMFAVHRLLALPVVEDDGRLIGMIDVQLYADEAVDLAESAERADLFQLIGVSVEQARLGSPWQGFRVRMPWLLCNLAGGLTCAVIAAVFQAVLAEFLLLAMFLPLVLTLSESISMQSMTLSLQQLHGTRVSWQRVWQRAAAEWKTAALLGLAAGAAVGTAAIFWGRGPAPGGVLLAAIAASMVLSASVGLGMPVLLRALRLDPHVAAGPVSLMLVDVLTTAAYLALATWWLL